MSYEDAIKFNLTYEDTSNEQISWIWVNGLNGYPNVDGSYFHSNNSWHGFATSHSCLINLYSKYIYELMIVRWSGYYDDKGVTDSFEDWNMVTLV